MKGTFQVRASDKARCHTVVNSFKVAATPDDLRSFGYWRRLIPLKGRIPTALLTIFVVFIAYSAFAFWN
jgi:hypothetical protein